MSIALRHKNTHSVCNINFSSVLSGEAAKVFLRLKSLIDYNIKLNALRERNAQKAVDFWGLKVTQRDSGLDLVLPKKDCLHCESKCSMSVKKFQGWKAGRFGMDRASWLYSETRLFCEVCAYSSVVRTYPEESGLQEVKNVDAFESMRGKFRIVEKVAKVSHGIHVENLDYAHPQRPLLVRLATAVLTCILLLIFGWVWITSKTNTGFAKSPTTLSESGKSDSRKSEQNPIHSVKVE